MYLAETFQETSTFPASQIGTIAVPPINVNMDRIQWARTYGGSEDDVAKCVIQASDGGFVLAGYTNSYGAGGSDMYLVKTDSNGNMQWNTTYGGAADDGASCVLQSSDGGYVLAGYTKLRRALAEHMGSQS